MNEIPLGSLFATLAVLLAVSGCFSLAETAMMAANRHRLKHRAGKGHRGARLALELLGRTDRLLGVILLGNNLINAAAATLTAVIVARLFGEGELALALGTVAVTFAILVFSEITPKVIGATHADAIAPYAAYALTPLLAPPVTWVVAFVNLFVQALLRLLRLQPRGQAEAPLTQEEIRSLVLEGHYFRGKHHALLANLFDLGAATVDDVMIPRHQIHAIDLAARASELREQLATSFHTRLPVCEHALDNIVGILHIKHVVGLAQASELDAQHLRTLLRPPYFVPAGTPLLAQLAQFQQDRQRLGLVVDEYGELKGLVTIEDIVEEIVGEFTTTAPGGGTASEWRREADGSLVVDGMTPLRLLNRRLGLAFPLTGPKTLSGLIVERLGDIPQAGRVLDIAGQRIEVLQAQERAVRVARLTPAVTPPVTTV